MELSKTKMLAAAYADLLKKYPVLLKKMPLAIGIYEQILAVVHDRALVAYALGKHTRSGTYLKALSIGGSRFNLDGSESGEVSEIHQAHANVRIAELNARDLAKKAAKKLSKAKPDAKRIDPATAPVVVQKPAVMVTIKKRRVIV
ncbi:ProQ/FINO family protein [Rugamonas apoptosis]|uniref:Osmoprotectant transporter activator n=1 Tax=Rugamonas apoptosis TaxID=2758570 RepID=A0A7W2IML6_9BURK|nr:ProQ/FINO family protein [Rugamonas apoptosis]MBA5689642.1 osmoprotectant transporter activator [Rugamonas apoptosis]